MMKYVEKSGSNTHSVGYEYDDINNLTALVETINGVKRETSYHYDDDNRPTSVNIGGSYRSYTYDTSGRVSEDVTRHHGSKLFTRSYTYRDASSGGTSTQPYRLVYTGDNFSTAFGYGYNTAGNIAYTNVDGSPNTYKYDSANQLIRENNRESGLTTLWTYDNAGNILKREVYPVTSGTPDPANKISEVIYTYGDDDWGDLLTAYNGVIITHDEIGNPLNDGTWSYTWQHGRQLASMHKLDGSAQWSFVYNADGLRTQRTNGTTTYNYTYLGGQLTHMTVDGHTMYLAYDAAGVPMSLTYDGTIYYYVTNLQGDVVAILDNTGVEVVTYSYDAWGNLLSTTGTLATSVGFYNPLHYRGYVYDEETGLYYLQSRYYNPEMGRFINADAFSSTGQGILGNNMFAYCGNNPINRFDPNGMFFQELFWDIYEAVLHIVAEVCGSSNSVGSAQPYIDTPGSDDPNSPNCYAYAIGSPTNEQPGATSGREYSDITDVYDVGKSVEADLHVKGFTVREISGPNGKILENEYRIALRVGTQPIPYLYELGYIAYDYHFMRQTDTGCWAEKHGIGGSAILWDDPSLTPDTIPWTAYGEPYYDSAIIYYAIGH